jgi:hypothetical protein
MAGDPIPPAPITATHAPSSFAAPRRQSPQDDVAGVAVELVVAQLHQRPVEPKPPAPRSVAPVRHLAKAGAQHRGRDQLRDPLPAPHLERLLPQIGEDHLHFAAIVAVDRAGRVEAGDAVLQRQPERGRTCTS